MSVAATVSPLPAGSRLHVVLPVAVIVTLGLIIVPLPTGALDVLITVNLATSIVVLLTSMYVPGPLHFSAFPSLLLLLTLFRLALNVASTRLILGHGDEGTRAAGSVIQAFGSFVVGGSFIVGLVIFAVVIVIQFVVVTHGSTRISEVMARFTLDAMPGKQMAIDGDLGAGLISEKEALERRAKIQNEAEFFGSMDGAVRFTQRDAVAALLITMINICAGLAIGVMQKGMPVSEAVTTYSVLTIGDGLVTAIPALLVAVSGGIITTRAAQEENLGQVVFSQLLFSPRPLAIAAATLFLLALVPGLPKVSFLLLAAVTFAGSQVSRRAEAKRAGLPEPAEAAPADADADADADAEIEPLLGVDPLCVAVGYDLISAVGATGPGGILDKVKDLRRQIATELGFVLPPVRVRDNLQLPADGYEILLRGVPIARGSIPRGRMLALDAGATREIEGEKTEDLAFGRPAVWIAPEQADEARGSGYTVVDSPSVLSTHLSEVIHRNAAELLGRDDTARLLDHLQKTSPKAVSELVPERMTIGELQRVLQGLLEERVPVKDLTLIVETLADAVHETRETPVLVEAVRRALARTLSAPLVDGKNVLEAVALAPDAEEELTTSLAPRDQDTSAPGLSPARAREIVTRITAGVADAGSRVAIVVGPRLRPNLARLLRQHLPHTSVLSTLEIPPDVTLRAVVTVA
ncbi:MAG: flagellar biosynthesis protein FlhA [Acidobacteriota bacterium]|nr:flagellar biosynthesis protein FlhA [Acidobacteriota bacterium]